MTRQRRSLEPIPIETNISSVGEIAGAFPWGKAIEHLAEGTPSEATVQRRSFAAALLCIALSLGGIPGEGILMSAFAPCSLNRITQFRSV